MHKILGSSVNPEKISLTLKSLVPFLVFLTAAFQLDISEGLIEEYISTLGSVFSGFFLLWGLTRKIYYAVKK
jgi:hypothetical protein